MRGEEFLNLIHGKARRAIEGAMKQEGPQGQITDRAVRWAALQAIDQAEFENPTAEEARQIVSREMKREELQNLIVEEARRAIAEEMERMKSRNLINEEEMRAVHHEMEGSEFQDRIADAAGQGAEGVMEQEELEPQIIVEAGEGTAVRAIREMKFRNQTARSIMLSVSREIESGLEIDDKPEHDNEPDYEL